MNRNSLKHLEMKSHALTSQKSLSPNLNLQSDASPDL